MELRGGCRHDVCQCRDRLETILGPDDHAHGRDPSLVKRDHPALPQFTKFTGIDVVTDFQLETAFLGALPIKLAGGSRTPDVFLFLTYGPGISSGWPEPLNAYYSDRSLTDLGWYDETDLLKTAPASPVWS